MPMMMITTTLGGDDVDGLSEYSVPGTYSVCRILNMAHFFFFLRTVYVLYDVFSTVDARWTVQKISHAGHCSIARTCVVGHE
jgi:hypothetical protein